MRPRPHGGRAGARGAIIFLQVFYKAKKMRKTGLGGFEPPTSGLEARRYVQAKPQTHVCQ